MKCAVKPMILIACCLMLAAFVQANDPWQDFTIAKNPNGVWTYGFTMTLGGQFVLADRPLINTIYPNFVQGYDQWALSSLSVCGDGVGGGVAHYPGQYLNGSEQHFEDTLEEHPGCHGEYATVRWTAPIAGTFQFVGSFNGMQLACGGTTTDVHIRWNSSHSLFDANVSGFTTNRDHWFDVQQQVAAGDSVDFLVGYGSNGNNSCDATAMQLDVDLVSGIDVDPGTTPNTISRTSKSTVPVAILSTPSFNAPAVVAQGSLTFGRIGNEASFVSNSCTVTDVNNDGLNDLVCQFKIQKAAFQLSDTVATLHGKTKTGITFVGTNAVQIVP